MDDRYSFKKSTDDRYRLRQACPSFRPEFVRVVIDNDIDGAEVWTWENRGVHSFSFFILFDVRYLEISLDTCFIYLFFFSFHLKNITSLGYELDTMIHIYISMYIYVYRVHCIDISSEEY